MVAAFDDGLIFAERSCRRLPRPIEASSARFSGAPWERLVALKPGSELRKILLLAGACRDLFRICRHRYARRGPRPPGDRADLAGKSVDDATNLASGLDLSRIDEVRRPSESGLVSSRRIRCRDRRSAAAQYPRLGQRRRASRAQASQNASSAELCRAGWLMIGTVETIGLVSARRGSRAGSASRHPDGEIRLLVNRGEDRATSCPIHWLERRRAADGCASLQCRSRRSPRYRRFRLASWCDNAGGGYWRPGDAIALEVSRMTIFASPRRFSPLTSRISAPRSPPPHVAAPT